MLGMAGGGEGGLWLRKDLIVAAERPCWPEAGRPTSAMLHKHRCGQFLKPQRAQVGSFWLRFHTDSASCGDATHLCVCVCVSIKAVSHQCVFLFSEIIFKIWLIFNITAPLMKWATFLQ